MTDRPDPCVEACAPDCPHNRAGVELDALEAELYRDYPEEETDR